MSSWNIRRQRSHDTLEDEAFAKDIFEFMVVKEEKMKEVRAEIEITQHQIRLWQFNESRQVSKWIIYPPLAFGKAKVAKSGHHLQSGQKSDTACTASGRGKQRITLEYHVALPSCSVVNTVSSWTSWSTRSLIDRENIQCFLPITSNRYWHQSRHLVLKQWISTERKTEQN